MKARRVWLAGLMLAITCSVGGGATVRFSVVATADPSTSAVAADPGGTVDYTITALVEPESADDPDTVGLSGFSASLARDDSGHRSRLR